MPVASRIDVVRECYRAYETGDREGIERHLADDFVFSAPPDVVVAFRAGRGTIITAFARRSMA